MKKIFCIVCFQALVLPNLACSAVFYSQASSAPNILANWNSLPGGGGGTPAGFNSTDTFVLQSGHTMTATANWRMSGGATLQVNGALDLDSYSLTGGSTNNFILANGATLITKNSEGINGCILGFRPENFPLNPAANYVFNGVFAQTTGSYLPAKVNNLTLSNSVGITVSKRTSVTSTLTTSGKLNLNLSRTASITASTLVSIGKTTIDILSENLTVDRSYPLIAYTMFSGSGVFELGSLPAGATGTLDEAGNNISLTIATPPARPTVQILKENGAGYLKFLVENGWSYRVFSSSDLFAWSHLVTTRGQGTLQWQIPTSELLNARRFFRISKVAATGVENLSGWASFISSGTGRFHIGFIGDSYTQNRSRFTKYLKQLLAEQYGNLGAGFLGFAGFSSTGLNGSIDNSELDYTINYAQWTTTNSGGYGPDAGHVTSSSSNASLSIKVLKTVDYMKLYYANNSGSAGFRYRLVVNGTQEEWKTVLTNAIAGLGTQTLNVQSYAAPYMIDIEALGVGVSLIGAEAVKTGNGIVAHKLGCSGGRAIHFAANDLAKAALNELNLDMAVIMFGTNEQGASQTPASFKTALQTLITSLRTQNPNMDLLLMLPCYTKYELENPKPYKLQDYGTVMRELATANNAAFMDFTEVFGPAVELQNLIDSGLMNADRVHPTTTGVGSGGFLIGDAIYVNVLTSP